MKRKIKNVILSEIKLENEIDYNKIITIKLEYDNLNFDIKEIYNCFFSIYTTFYKYIVIQDYMIKNLLKENILMINYNNEIIKISKKNDLLKLEKYL